MAPRLIHESYKQIPLVWQRRAQPHSQSSGLTAGRGYSPVFFIVSIVIRIVFPLIPIVLARRLFSRARKALRCN
jgi:hypothetical protein